MIILLTILIILYALTSCKEKIQEKKGNEDNWKVYQQLEEKDEYYGAAEPPVRCGESHLSGLTEPPQFVY